MITLVSGDQTLTLSEVEAVNVLKIQEIMKATAWQLPSQYEIKDGIIVDVKFKTFGIVIWSR